MKQKKSYLCLVLALVLILVSGIGASSFQTAGGKITIKNLTWESPSGHMLSADLYIPPNATKEAPAPAVVTIEGWYNNKEMQDLYTVELARRGYVVLALDLHGHGNSEALPPEQLYDGAVGVDGAVQLVADLPYVDTARIGVTGHSSGGTAANMAVSIDNERDIPLIKCVLQQAGDWQDDTGGDHSGDYGSRSVGIIASEHDDFYFGTYDDAGNMLTSAKEFLTTPGAKKFLNFNEDPVNFGEAVGGQYYTREFDGETSYRVIYRPTIIHPAVTFSPECVDYAIDFFERTLGAPHPLPVGDQVWLVKTAFNAVGLAGFFLFLVSFTLVMLDTKVFGVLKAKEEAAPVPIADRTGHIWFWCIAAVSILFSGASYLFCMNTVYSNTTEFFPQTGPYTIGIWSLVCGVFALVLMALSYFCYGRKRGFSMKERGVSISLEVLWKTVALAVIVIVCSFSLVFFTQYFFQTDFRLWVLAVKTFGPDKVIIALKYLPFFLLFYIANSISVNCFNYNTVGGKKGFGNILLLGLFNSIACIAIVAYQYVTFYTAGYQPLGLTEGQRMMPIWLFPIIFILFGAAIISRIIYKKTKNPYLAGIINAMFVVLISCSNTFTTLGAGALICTTF